MNVTRFFLLKDPNLISITLNRYVSFSSKNFNDLGDLNFDFDLNFLFDLQMKNKTISKVVSDCILVLADYTDRIVELYPGLAGKW